MTQICSYLFARNCVKSYVSFPSIWISREHRLSNIIYVCAKMATGFKEQHSEIQTEPAAIYGLPYHYNDVIMDAVASKITSLAIVYSTVYSGADQRKHQSSASLAFVRRTGDRWSRRTKGQWRGRCFHLMTSSYFTDFTKNDYFALARDHLALRPLLEVVFSEILIYLD